MNTNLKNVWLNKIYFLLLLLFTLTYIVSAQHVPMSEDAGLYAFLSKSIANGSVLHVDIPMSTNGFLIYVIAQVFKIVSPSLMVYRFIYSLGYLLLVFSCFFIVKKRCGVHTGFLAAFLIALFTTEPHINLDLGRNPIIFSTACVFLGLQCKLADIRYSNFFFGLLLGLAAIIRETFIVIPIYYCIQELLLSFVQEKPNNKLKDLKPFVVGMMLALAINALILTYYHTWSAYYYDVFHSGAQFRYKLGFFTLARLRDNLSHITYDYTNFYAPLIILALASYFIKTSNIFINNIKYFLVPAFVIEALFINATREYSVVPILVACSILTSFYLFSLAQFYNKSVESLRVYLSIVLLFFFLWLLPTYLTNIGAEYEKYFKSSRVATNAVKSKNYHIKRLLDVIDVIPHKTIAAFSQYPMLFNAKNSYAVKYPFAEDLSAPENLANPVLLKAQLAHLVAQKADVVVLKRNAGTYPQDDVAVKKVLYQSYLPIADFDAPDQYSYNPEYLDTIFISKNNFVKNYKAIGTASFVLSKNTVLKNHTIENTILKIQTLPDTCIKNLVILSGVSHSEYSNYATNKVLYAFVKAGDSYQIKQKGVCAKGKNFKLIQTQFVADPSFEVVKPRG